VLVALVATDEQLDEALDLFEAAVEQALGVPRMAATAG
jgi:transcriptional regulator GlxA family with amidase domain